MTNTLSSLYNESSHITSPHCLMELSNREWDYFKASSILVSGIHQLSIDKKTIVSYNTITYGDKIVTMKRRKVYSDKPIWYNEVNIAEQR